MKKEGNTEEITRVKIKKKKEKRKKKSNTKEITEVKFL